MGRPRKEEMAVATKRAVATSPLCAAQTAVDVCQKTRLSSDSLSGTWSRVPLSEISRTLASSMTIQSQNCISRLLTAYLVLFTHTVSLFCSTYLFSLFPVVRVRSREGRRNRNPPPRIRWKDGKKVNPAVAAAEDAKAQQAQAKA